MKKFISGVVLFAISSLLSFVSCKKTESTPTPVTTLSTINNDPTLSVFSAIVSRSGDANTINTATVFAIPVDSAFATAGITASGAASLTVSQCDSIVKYYTLSSPLNFNDSTNKEIAFPTVLGPSLFADSTGTALYFNGIAALSPTPVIMGSASIYKLSQFINIPVTTISQISMYDTSLTLFNEAFNKISFASSLSVLGNSFTMFMPTNTAFIKAGYPDIATIDATDPNTLTQLLLYNTVANNYFPFDLTKQTSLTTLQGEPVMVGSNGGLEVTGNSDAGTPSVILNNGQLAGNIVTYKINTVLLP